MPQDRIYAVKEADKKSDFRDELKVIEGLLYDGRIGERVAAGCSNPLLLA